MTRAAEVRDMGEGLTVTIGRFHTQRVRGQGGADVMEPAVRVSAWINFGHDINTHITAEHAESGEHPWNAYEREIAHRLVEGTVRFDENARNKLGETGAYAAVAPARDRIEAAVAQVMVEARRVLNRI